MTIDEGERLASPFSHVLALPRLAARIVARPRLTRRLDRLAALTLVQAMPGYGATTLVAGWVRTQLQGGAVVDWIDAGAGSDAPEALLDRVRGAVTRGGPTGRVIVVIDGDAPVGDAAVIDELCILLSREPTLHLVVCSTHTHPLRRAAGRSGIEINALAGRDLALTAPELQEFAEAWGHDLDEDQAVRLHDLAGGWALPSRLILDDTQQGAAEFRSDSALSFLRITVMPQVVDADEREIALRVALLSTITEDAVALVLPESASAERSAAQVIERFDLLGLLEHLSGSGDAARWRFSGLVRGVLAGTLERQQPEEATRISRMLARWRYDPDDLASLDEVLDYIRAGEDWEFLDQLSARHWPEFAAEFADESAAVYAAVPAEAIARFPGLAVWATVMDPLIIDTDEPDLRALLRRYMGAGERGLAGLDSYGSADELGAIAVAAMISLRAAGRYGAALGLAARLEEELAVREARGDRPHAQFQRAWFSLQRGMTFLLAGDRNRAIELSVQSFAAATNRASEFVRSNAAAQLALIHTLRGETIDAQHWLAAHERVDTGDQWVDYLIGLPARVAKAHRALDRLDLATASVELEAAGDASAPVEMWAFIIEAATRRALLFGEPIAMLARLEQVSALHAEVVRGGGAPRLIVDRCSVELYLALGELNHARKILSGSTDPGLMVARARLELIAGRPGAAREAAALRLWHPETSVRNRIGLLMILAAAHLAEGDDAAAVESFTRAHALAEEVVTLTPYALLSASTRSRLFELSGIVLPPENRSRIEALRAVYPDRGDLVTLSARETTVLVAMATNPTLAGVAAALTVSINTVKKQTVSIYAKLGVHDRASALARAHQLGLVNETRPR